MLQLGGPLRDQVFNFVTSKSSGYQTSPALNTQSDETLFPSWVMDWRFAVSPEDFRYLRSRSAKYLYPDETCVQPDSVAAGLPPRPGPEQTLLLDGCFYAGVVVKTYDYTCDLDYVERESEGHEAYAYTYSERVRNSRRLDEAVPSGRVAWVETLTSLAMGYGAYDWGGRIWLGEKRIGNSLVPWSTQIGDIVVIKSATMLPLVLNPVHLQAENFLEPANHLCRILGLCDKDDCERNEEWVRRSRVIEIMREHRKEFVAHGNEFSYRGPLITKWRAGQYDYTKSGPELQMETIRMDVTIV